jgi:hypothetical protein
MILDAGGIFRCGANGAAMKFRQPAAVTALLVAMVVTAPLGTAAQSTPPVPHVVMAQLPNLKEIDRFSALPVPIRDGEFAVDGTSARGWTMAEPGGKFSSTDVPVPGAPGRRLIFAACAAELCLIHYERGGIAHFYEILGLSLGSKGWTAVWNARGSKPIASLNALRAMLQHGTLGEGWGSQTVKGDF